jgi:hypothetical protein
VGALSRTAVRTKISPQTVFQGRRAPGIDLFFGRRRVREENRAR